MEQTSVPEFGTRINDAIYVDRPGAYGIIFDNEGRVAFVRGQGGRLYLPGGGITPDEYAKNALAREIREEIGWACRIVSLLCRATQFLFAEGEGYFAIRATYFRAELLEPLGNTIEHEIVWLLPSEAGALARESDAWAISQACGK